MGEKKNGMKELIQPKLLRKIARWSRLKLVCPFVDLFLSSKVFHLLLDVEPTDPSFKKASSKPKSTIKEWKAKEEAKDEAEP